MNESKPSTEGTVAVLVPCRNEEHSIGRVVSDFRAALPHASIYVYDNCSADATAARAREAGAIVRAESRPGKGNVVQRMFADIEADVYVLVDGDDTYDAASAPMLMDKLVRDELDMVVASRLSTAGGGAFRHGHQFGNRVLTRVVAMLFKHSLDDMLSGYRIFSRRFVKSFPALAVGFETETELTIHALALRMPVAEIAAPYKIRGDGSQSKLRTYRDGLRILSTILVLFKGERPLVFFSSISATLVCVSLALGYPVLVDYFQTGLVPRFPTAILATGVMILAFLSLACGFILDTVTRGRREMRRLFYLATKRYG
jgi:glycosyltransferase involved in cell wall biosynthesis